VIEDEGIGDRFQRETKYNRASFESEMMDLSKMSEPYKEYPESNIIELPTVESFELPKKMVFNEVLQMRKSIREFSDEPLSLGQLAYLLWASTGIQRYEMGYAFRTAPSAGALYPIETYLAINNLFNMDNGIYHYNIKNHALEELELGDFNEVITHAAFDQPMFSEAAVIFIWTAIFGRSKWKYKQRAYRYVYLDAGHIAENLTLTVTALGLGSCNVGALFDDEINNIIGIDGTKESVIYLAVVGRISEPDD
jgi:SagB-type dehydrogenase family enzyme